jgi:hypothetical protein
MNELHIFITLFVETEYNLIKENRKKIDVHFYELLKGFFIDNVYDIDEIHDVICIE